MTKPQIVDVVHHKGSDFSIPECVATILSSRKSGALGEYVKLDGAACGIDPVTDHYARVTAGGRTFIALSYGRSGLWNITFKGFEGIDRDPETATRLALSGGATRDVSRNYPIHGATL